MLSILIRCAVVLGGLALGPAAHADAGHAHEKPPGGMQGMDHGKTDHGQMDHSKMQEHWTAPAEMAKRESPVPADAASLGRGKQIFETNCASCHGPTGKGDGPAARALNPKPADLATMAPQHSPGDLAWKVETGRGAMPPWKGVLTQDQIWEVVNYVRSLGGERQAPSKPSGGHAH